MTGAEQNSQEQMHGHHARGSDPMQLQPYLPKGGLGAQLGNKDTQRSLILTLWACGGVLSGPSGWPCPAGGDPGPRVG